MDDARPADVVHGREHSACRGKRRGAEEYPSASDGKEGQGACGDVDLERTLPRRHPDTAAQVMPAMVQRQHEAVHGSPQNKRPCGAVPKPPEQHRDRQIEVAARHAVSVSSERYVDEIAQKARQRNVPAPPKVDDVYRLVRGIEIDRQHDAE